MDKHRARSIEEIIGRAHEMAEGDQRVIVGITGPPGAGKTTIAHSIVENVGDRSRLVGMDGFHIAQKILVETGKSERKGAIDTFDGSGFVALVRRLRGQQSETIYAPEFQRDIDEAISAAVSIEPHVRLVVIEGNYLLASKEPWRELRSLLDEVWYLEVEESVRISNLIARHESFGKPNRAARDWALGSDQQNARLVFETRDSADFIVSVGRDNDAYVANNVSSGDVISTSHSMATPASEIGKVGESR